MSRGPGGPRGAPWAIALEPGTGDYGDLANPEAFLGEILAENARRSHEGGPPRVFVQVRWNVAPDAEFSKWDHQVLVIEASLLGLDEEDLTS